MRKCLLEIAVSMAMLLGPAGVRAEGLFVHAEAGWTSATAANIHDPEKDPLQPTWVNGAAGNPGHFDAIGASVLLGVGVGRRIRGAFRVEADYGFRGGFRMKGTGPTSVASTSTADVASHAVVVSAYRDFRPDARMQPYLGAGVGWAHNTVPKWIEDRANVPRYSLPEGSRDQLAWQAGAGAGWKLSKRFTVDFGYRYFSAGKIDSDAGEVKRLAAPGTLPTAGVEGHLAAHELRLAFRLGG